MDNLPLGIYLSVHVTGFITRCIFFVCHANNNLYVIVSVTGRTSGSLNLTLLRTFLTPIIRICTTKTLRSLASSKLG
jgi:hypothetical protein